MRPAPLLLPPIIVAAVAAAIPASAGWPIVVQLAVAVLVAVTPPIGAARSRTRPDGPPADAAVQATASDVAAALGIPAVPVHVSTARSAIAGVTRGPAGPWIEVGQRFLRLDGDTQRAVLAHEAAHIRARHFTRALVAGAVCWATPAVAAVAGAAATGRWWYAPGVAVGVGVPSVACWCAVMRRHELAADSLAATIPGVAAPLAAALTPAQTSGPFDIHPSSDVRCAALAECAP